MNIEPVNDCILVELTKSDSAIVIADDGQSIIKGRVVSTPKEIPYLTGNGWINVNANDCPFEVGQVVYFRKYADQDCLIKEDGKDFALIRINDVMGVLNV